MHGWIFLAAYLCSGVAGLVYQVTWARLFSLHLGHTTAAASTVFAIFMGGLSGGALLAGRYADRLTPRTALRVYALLESIVLVSALALPATLAWIAPALGYLYNDGNGGVLFVTVRALVCASLLIVPTLSLGATFPIAVRWFVGGGAPRRSSGTLYAVNTVGAAIGSLSAGFVLLPALGHFTTTLVAAAATGISIVIALLLARINSPAAVPALRAMTPQKAGRGTDRPPKGGHYVPDWVAGCVVAVTGFATFVLEIAWMRLLALVLGPSTYAFSATVAAFITAIATGSLLSEAWLTRTRRQSLALAISLALVVSGVATVWASSYTGSSLVRQIASGGPAWLPPASADALIPRVLLAASVVMPGAVVLGMLFPLTLDLVQSRTAAAAHRVARLYALSAVASVAGAIIGGFAMLPWLGLESTIRVASAVLFFGAFVVVLRTTSSRKERLAIGIAIGAGAIVLVPAPSWDRDLLANGVYRPELRQASLEADSHDVALRAGSLLYYRDGSTATVSVKRLNGALSLAIDGKVDASTSGDMLTQRLLAHLPLLIHERPQKVAIIGLGSGVTLASALVHPVTTVDVVELSGEVVEGSKFFANVNHGALADRRTHLIVADGRTHLRLSRQRYDVIVSEPSNPWMAGVAPLFTREFFLTARARLAPNGILCQWTHTYNMSSDDLRSIVATFVSVFPQGTMWRVGDGDLLLVGSPDRDPPLGNIETAWHRPGVAKDLESVSAHEPFAVLSMFAGGPNHLHALALGALLQTDDRLALEFSGPLAVFDGRFADNRAMLEQIRHIAPAPAPVARALAAASAGDWQRRGEMMRLAEADATAYEDFSRSIAMDPSNRASLEGLVETALALGRGSTATSTLRALSSTRPRDSGPLIALSKLQAALGQIADAIESARRACELTPEAPEAIEQLASIHADLGDADHLSQLAGVMRRLFPYRAKTHYYTAAAEFLEGRLEPALGAVEHAIAIDSEYASAHNLRGAVHARLGHSAAARTAFAKALSLNPRDSAIYNNYGLLELAMGNREAAARMFREALAIDPASPVSRQGLAEARVP